MSKSIRLSQTLSPFGVGAIVDIEGESFVATDIREWGPRGEKVRCERLEASLGLSELRAAPSFSGRAPTAARGVPYYRFPRWLFCPACSHLTKLNFRDETGEQPKCATCRTSRLVPMRFVAICKNGHLGDVDWRYFAHREKTGHDQNQCQKLDLEFYTRQGAGTGLGALIVRCRACGASKTLSDITNPGATGMHCRGRQPWEHARETSCTERIEVVQRGASNVYFPTIASALDIPPGSDYDPDSDLKSAVRNHVIYAALVGAPDAPFAADLVKHLVEETGATPLLVQKLVTAEGEGGMPAEARDGLQNLDLLQGEWQAFLEQQRDVDERSNFVTRPADLWPSDTARPAAVKTLDGLVEQIVLAPRLREVRALWGFRRYDPGAELVAADLGGQLTWRPAVETFGEGVFLRFREDPLLAWENLPEVEERVKLIENRRRTSYVGSRHEALTARYILLHTLAHLMIRRLAFTCGYSSAALRERLYCRTGHRPQAGLLIYTAAGDSEGTLGGLVRQGEPPRLVRTLLESLEEAQWCSSDPVCRESRGQGFSSLNLAACHACALASETSCETGNSFLDRALVVGGEECPGFFERVAALASDELGKRLANIRG